jgi:hypothetical protein
VCEFSVELLDFPHVRQENPDIGTCTQHHTVSKLHDNYPPLFGTNLRSSVTVVLGFLQKVSIGPIALLVSRISMRRTTH